MTDNEGKNLEMLLVKVTDMLIEQGFHSSTVAAAFLRASACMASLKGTSLNQFLAVAASAFRAVAVPKKGDGEDVSSQTILADHR